jgi:hypothetical protein
LMASSSTFPNGMMGRRAMGYVKERSPGVEERDLYRGSVLSKGGRVLVAATPAS